MKNLLMKGAMTARLHGMLMLQGEVYVLSTWIRTGFWATEEAQKYLDIQQESSGSGLVLHAPDKELFFSVRLKKKEIVAYIIIDKATCLPLWVSFQKFSFRDRWKLSNWQCVYMRYTKSGHYMVRPIVDGKEVGCFIIDTRTGCLAINN